MTHFFHTDVVTLHVWRYVSPSWLSILVQLLIISLWQESGPVNTDRPTAQPTPGAPPLINPEPASTPAAPPAALPTAARSSALVPVVSPAHAEPSEELTVDSQRDSLVESAGATVDSVRTPLLPYLTLMARHQVQLSISPPLQGDVCTQHRLNDAFGFDQVLAAVQRLSDTLPDLLHVVRELTAQLKISREEFAAAKRLLVPVHVRVESLETLLFNSMAEVNELQAEIKRLNSANNLWLAMNYAEEKQDIIDALDKQIERERDVFKTTVSANTEKTRKLHNLLPKAAQGTWVDADTAALIADLKDRNLHLLQTNRALRGFVSFASIDPNTLTPAIQGLRAAKVDLSTLGLDQDTILALQRFQQEAGNQEDPFAFAKAQTKAAQQVQSGASKRSRHGSDDGSSDASSERRSQFRLVELAEQCQQLMAWKNKLKSKHQKTASRFRFFMLQPGFSPLGIAAACAFALSGPCQIARESPEVSFALFEERPTSGGRGLNEDGSDEDMEEESPAVPTEPEETDVPRQASPNPPEALHRSNVASSPPARASPRALTSYELEVQLLFGSDDDEDAPSGSKASREPAGHTAPNRSSSDEDTPSPPKRSDRAPICKQPSVPPLRSSDSSDSESSDSSERALAMVLTTVIELVEMILVTTSLRSISLLVILLVMKTFRRRPTFLVHLLLSRALLLVFQRASRGQESSSSAADYASRENSSGAPQASSPLSRVLTSSTTPRHHHPPPGSALSRTSLLSQEAGPGRVIVATYTSRRRRGDPDPPVPLPMTHQTVRGIRPAVLPSASFPPWVRPFLDLEFRDQGAKKCFEQVLSTVLPDPTP
ncbi:hypothetical protein F442_22246, partial [Phytophthora nicotianae P10297]